MVINRSNCYGNWQLDDLNYNDLMMTTIVTMETDDACYFGQFLYADPLLLLQICNICYKQDSAVTILNIRLLLIDE